jgi:hypothetical protein
MPPLPLEILMKISKMKMLPFKDESLISLQCPRLGNPENMSTISENPPKKICILKRVCIKG